MEYESSRAIAEMKMAEFKRMALEASTAYNLTGDVPDPNWAQPAETSHLGGVGLDQAHGFWINGGKMGSEKDDNISYPEFSHDLETLAKDGPTVLPTIPKDESVTLTTSEIKNRIAAREDPMAEQLNDAKNMSVDDYNKPLNIGPNGEPVYRQLFPTDEKFGPLLPAYAI
jgi:hypothetical protein